MIENSAGVYKMSVELFSISNTYFAYFEIRISGRIVTVETYCEKDIYPPGSI